MSKSVTVKFDDGTSHVYEDVPDDVSDTEVEDRASNDFGKKVAGVNLPTEVETAKQNYENAGAIEKVGGAINAGANLLGQAITSPVGHVVEAGVAGKYAVDKISNALNNRPGPVAPAPAMAPAAQAQPAQAVNARPALSVQTGGAAPVVPQGMPAEAPAMPRQATSLMNSAQSIVQKLALDKVLKNAGPIAAGMQVAQGLFGTSEEEIRKMKEAEARKRAQGWKPLNER